MLWPLRNQSEAESISTSTESTAAERHILRRPQRFFFGTRALPCPYLAGRQERKVVTDLSGPESGALYERLLQAGFRRSHGLAYRPACPGCNACVPVRIVVDDFDETRSFRRIKKKNADLAAEIMGATTTIEQYQLFINYQRHQHPGGEMSEMTFGEYRMMVEESPLNTIVVEFRDGRNQLVAILFADQLDRSLSAVYSCYDLSLAQRSLGTYMILWLLDRARGQGLEHVYLGYWIAESRKMAYKARFRPLEGRGPESWRRLKT